MAQYTDLLPQTGMMPNFSPEEVQEFVALGKQGRRLHNAGEIAKAEAAFRDQLAIHGLNAEPYLSLAMLAAGRGETKAALDHMEAAIVRGFKELRWAESSEAWVNMPRKGKRVQELRDAVLALAERERNWPSWDAFKVPTVPADLDIILDRRRRSGTPPRSAIETGVSAWPGVAPRSAATERTNRHR